MKLCKVSQTTEPQRVFVKLFSKVYYIFTNISMCETEFKHQAVRWVSHTFAGAGPHQFVENFQLPFTPQFLKIKTIGYYYDGTEPLTHLLQMARIGIIGNFHDKLVSHPNMSYKLGQVGWQDGQYQFQVLSDENNLEGNVMAGRICICIEFLG